MIVTPILSIVIVGSAVGALVYWGGVFWLGLLQVEEVEQLVHSLPNTFRRAGETVFRLVEPLC